MRKFDIFLIVLGVVVLLAVNIAYRALSTDDLSIADKAVFKIGKVSSAPRECDKGECRDVSVTLVNQLDRSVSLLGGAAQCSRAGCYEVLDLPADVPPGGNVQFRIRAEWYDSPPHAHRVFLFSNLAAGQFIELSLLPDSASLAADEPSAAEPSKTTGITTR